MLRALRTEPKSNIGSSYSNDEIPELTDEWFAKAKVHFGGVEELHWTPEMVSRFWANQPSESYFSYQVGRVLVRRFRKFLGNVVADICPGDGSFGVDLSADGITAFGVELDDNPNFITKHWFSSVCLIEVLEHLYDAELAKALNLARELLADTGYLIITTPNNEDRSQSMLTSPESGLRYHRWQHVRSFTQATLTETLNHHGFRVVECGVTDFGRSIHAHYRNMAFPARLLRTIAKSIWRTNPHLYAVAQRAA